MINVQPVIDRLNDLACAAVDEVWQEGENEELVLERLLTPELAHQLLALDFVSGQSENGMQALAEHIDLIKAGMRALAERVPDGGPACAAYRKTLQNPNALLRMLNSSRRRAPQSSKEDAAKVTAIIEKLDAERMWFDGGYPTQYVIEHGKVYWARLDDGKEGNAPELIVRTIADFIEDYGEVLNDDPR